MRETTIFFVRLVVVLALLGCFGGALSGCASTLSSMLYPAISGSIPIWTGTVHTVRPYSVTWLTVLPGSEDADDRKLPEKIIAEGGVENWRWTVRGPDDGNIETPASTSQWNDSMSRLYTLTDFLLGTDPPPVSAAIYLVERDVAIRREVTLSGDDHVPLQLIAPYYGEAGDSKRIRIERTADLLDAMAAIGSQLQAIFLAEDMVRAPTDGGARAVKAAANANCWRLAVRPGIVAGTDVNVKSPPAVHSQLLTTFREMHERHPDDLTALNLYAAGLLFRDAERFLHSLDLRWPTSGTDIAAIDALLGFCRSYLQYPGDVRATEMPLDGVVPAGLFTETAATR